MVTRVASAGVTTLKWGVCTLGPLGLDRFLHRLQAVKALDKKNPLLSRVITIFAPSAVLLHLVNHSSWKTTLVISSILTAGAIWNNKGMGKSQRKAPEIVNEDDKRPAPILTPSRSFVNTLDNDQLTDARYRDFEDDKKKLLRARFWEVLDKAGALGHSLTIQLRLLDPVFGGPIKLLTGIDIIIFIFSKETIAFYNTGNISSCKDRFSCSQETIDTLIEFLMDRVETIKACMAEENGKGSYHSNLTNHVLTLLDTICGREEGSANSNFTVGRLFNNVNTPQDRHFKIKVTIEGNKRTVRFITYSSEKKESVFRVEHTLNSEEFDVTKENSNEQSMPLHMEQLQIIDNLETSAHTLVIREYGKVFNLNGERVPYDRLLQIASFKSGSEAPACLRIEQGRLMFNDQVLDQS